jgi:hypothetical protein
MMAGDTAVATAKWLMAHCCPPSPVDATVAERKLSGLHALLCPAQNINAEH